MEQSIENNPLFEAFASQKTREAATARI